ncbi:MAG: mechanosensitive ion channel protein [Cyanobacteriota bacterium]|nr:mechanosensitive ion channel protein [Cyanobacteriota bacterium]
MLILDSQQVEYCYVTRQVDSQTEKILAIAYKGKFFIKIKSYNKDDRQKAIAKAREIFLKYKGQLLFALLEEPTTLTLWYEDKQVRRIAAPQRSILDDLVAQMRGEGGLVIKDRRQGLQKYPRCFVGSEAVTWIAQLLKIPREEAVAVGQKLFVAKTIHHVLDEHPFKDEYLFYRFYEDE